ncbi:PREDICTED: uncharacterized protein LOC106546990 isoform X2 [Thamnophis sirtalis]|uniref:Uncharacterized protein LOC106546990 isoform X2 n=1 Tax=Thamnophis sirtalis TaxID=35019 RepID=A0A6I9XZU5_9SAUR|nr:PREDICTED: uncharacterized protein LOC106546990 isoform X2 [Thamnophis sirtalis]
MEQFVHLQKEAIFHSAVEKMRQQLERLQQSIYCSLQSVAQELATSIRMQFEPLLRPVRRNKEILPALQRLCAKVDKLCQRSGVDYLLPTALQPEERPPATEAQEPGGGDCALSPAGSVDVRVGALPLPHLAAIEQQSLESAEPPVPPVPSAPEPIADPGTPGQTPQGPLLLPWQPHGRKRAGEAVLPQLEKKTKPDPVAPAGVPWLPCSQRAEMKSPSCTAAFLGSCSPGASRPDGPLCPMAESPEEGEPLAVPCSAELWPGNAALKGSIRCFS